MTLYEQLRSRGGRSISVAFKGDFMRNHSKRSQGNRLIQAVRLRLDKLRSHEILVLLLLLERQENL